MDSIIFKNVCLGYKKKVVIEIENLEFINTNSYYIVAGNGYGKTTLIKSLFNVSEIISGIIKAPKEISYFPAEILFSKYLTCFEYIKLSKVKYSHQNEFNYLIEEFYDHSVAELSMGQINRFLLYLTMNKDAKFYIIDELLNAIDQKTKNKFIDAIKLKKGIIIITHDENLISEHLCEYIEVKL